MNTEYFELWNNGKKSYTHLSWLSMNQRRALLSIIPENNKLAWYYTFGCLAITAVFSRRIPPLISYINRVGFYQGTFILGAGYFILWKSILLIQSKKQISAWLLKNDHSCTPFWFDRNKIIDLKAGSPQDQVFYVNRARGIKTQISQLQPYHPDFILKA